MCLCANWAAALEARQAAGRWSRKAVGLALTGVPEPGSQAALTLLQLHHKRAQAETRINTGQMERPSLSGTGQLRGTETTEEPVLCVATSSYSSSVCSYVVPMLYRHRLDQACACALQPVRPLGDADEAAARTRPGRSAPDSRQGVAEEDGDVLLAGRGR